MRRAALASFAFATAARSSRAEKSVRVIATALRQFTGFLTNGFALLEARIQHENQVTQRRG